MQNSAYVTDCLPSIIQHNLELKLRPHAGEKLGKKPADTCLVLEQSPNPLAITCFQFAQMSAFSSHCALCFLDLSQSLTNSLHHVLTAVSKTEHTQENLERRQDFQICPLQLRGHSSPVGPLWMPVVVFSVPKDQPQLPSPSGKEEHGQRLQIPSLPKLRGYNLQPAESLGRDPLAWPTPPSEGPSRLLCQPLQGGGDLLAYASGLLWGCGSWWSGLVSQVELVQGGEVDNKMIRKTKGTGVRRAPRPCNNIT